MYARRFGLTLAAVVVAVASGACGNDGGIDMDAPARIEPLGSAAASAPVGSPVTLAVIVRTGRGEPAEGVTVQWLVLDGGGQITPASAVTGANGGATATFVLGPTAVPQAAQASVDGLSGSPVVFTTAATPQPGGGGGGGGGPQE